MKIIAPAPRAMAQKKPLHGEPCNRCGLCCFITPCPLALAVFGPIIGPCPALGLGPNDTACGMIEDPARFAPERTAEHGEQVMRDAAAFLIGSGLGCDARLESEPENKAFNHKLDQRHWRFADLMKQAKYHWGLPL